MEGEVITRQECTNSMQRVHTRIDEISNCSIEVKTSAKNIEKMVNDMHNIMFGSEKGEGLITRQSNLSQKVSGVYFFGGVVLVSLIGALVTIFIKEFHR
jgi:hypothetical protein